MENHINRRDFLRLTGAGAAGMMMPAFSFAKEKRTNVILIMSDDTGYEVFGCYGSKQYQTPRIDNLAETGMRFNHCYAQPLCAPSRVQIMTGKSNVRNYVWWGVLDRNEKTTGQMMKDAGYATCVAGKWQLYGTGLGFQSRTPELKGTGTLPEDAGFDEHCLWQVESKPSRYWKPGLRINGQPKTFPDENAFGPTICADHICDFIGRNKEKPFFVYYPMMLTHAPFVTTPDSTDRASTDKQTNFEDMVAYMDKLVGRIVDKLDETGVRDNTLILFTGDNGTPKRIKSELNGRAIMGGKSMTTDAGTRVPLVANMPGSVPAGKVTDDLVDFTDMMPTIGAMAGVKMPAGEAFDGVSFAPQLRGRKGTPREWIYCYYEPVPGPEPKPTIFARDQRWKLYGDGRLYDISGDVLEENPVTDGGPARKKLQAALDSMPSEGMKIHRRKKASAEGSESHLFHQKAQYRYLVQTSKTTHKTLM